MNDTNEQPHLVGEESKFCKVKTTKLVCVEYPGFIKNVDKMLATVGGEKKLSETYYKGKCRLQMTYRPEDLNAHFVCADLVPCTGLLMKIKRRKKKTLIKKEPCEDGREKLRDSSKQTNTADNEFEYQQEIVGVVKEQYKFHTLMDYQYLVPEPMWNYYNHVHGSELAHEKFPPHFPPPIFGRIDTCGSYDYRPDPVQGRNPLISKELSENFQDSVIESAGNARKRRQAESMAALFQNESLPQEPSKGAVAILANLQKGSDSNAINTICKLFKDRPIWSKFAISCQVSVSYERLKKIIQYYGYYWLSGPWRTMWCRMGYDPRKDPKAKMYQMIDFRLRDSKESKRGYKLLVPRRSHKNYIPRNLQSRTLPHGSSVLAASEKPTDEITEDPQPYIFEPNKMLASRNMMFQLCDIHDDEIRKIIHENDGIETRCDEKEGWFPPGTMARIRGQMTKTVDEYFKREKQKQRDDKEAEINATAFDNNFVEEDVDDTSADTNFVEGVEDSPFQSYSYLEMLEGQDASSNYDDYDGYYEDD